MPRKRVSKTATLPDGSIIVDDGLRFVVTRPDGTTEIHTGIYFDTRKPLPKFTDLSAVRTGPADTPDDVLVRAETEARDLLRPHLDVDPLKPAEVLAIKSQWQPLAAGEYPNWPMVFDGPEHFAVKPKSRGLPIIRAASDVLTWVRRIRKKGGTPSFLAGVRLGALVERMRVVAHAEPRALMGLRRLCVQYAINEGKRKKANNKNAEYGRLIASASDEYERKKRCKPKMATVLKIVTGQFAERGKRPPKKSALQRAFRSLKQSENA